MDTPQKIIDDIVGQCESDIECEREEHSGAIKQAPGRIQALIDAAREEGKREARGCIFCGERPAEPLCLECLNKDV